MSPIFHAESWYVLQMQKVVAFQPNAGWAQLTPADASTLATDAAGDVAADFPGYGVWYFSAPDNNWVQLRPSQSPSAREGPSMVWDPVIGHVVLIGGQSGATFLNDTWVLDPH